MKQTIVLLLSLLSIIACDEVENCEEACDFLNDVTDLIAFLDPNRTEEGIGTLYLREAYFTDILRELDAVADGTGTYDMMVPALDGEQVPFKFQLLTTNSPYLFVTDSGPEEVLSKFKVYRDADCRNLTDAEPPGDCMAHGNEYYKAEAKQWDSCTSGTGICTEVQKVTWIIYYYEDAACTILDRIETEKEYDC